MSQVVFKCEAFPYQRGDVVYTPNGKRGKVTAVGIQWCPDRKKVLGIVYRVGRATYWQQWQLKLVKQ